MKSRGRGTQSAIPNWSQAARGSTLRERDAEKDDYNSFFALHQFSVAWVGAPGARAQSLTRPGRARLLSPDTTSTPIPPPPPESPPLEPRFGSPRDPSPRARPCSCCRCSSLKGADRSVLNRSLGNWTLSHTLPFLILYSQNRGANGPFFPTTRFLLFSHPPSPFFFGNVEVSNISVQWEMGGNFRFSGLSVVRLQKFWALPLQRNRRPIDGQRGSHRGGRHRSKNRRRSFAPRVSAPR